MKAFNSPVFRLLVAASLAGVLGACQKTETAEEKGPAEKVGQKIDQAAARAGDELNKAAEVAGKGLQKLGQKIQDGAEQAQQSQQKKD